MARTHTPSSGKVAIVEIAATDMSPAVCLVEVSLDGETLTISDQTHDLSDAARALARQLIDLVRKEHNGKRT